MDESKSFTYEQLFGELSESQKSTLSSSVSDMFYTNGSDVDPISLALAALPNGDSEDFTKMLDKYTDGKMASLDMVSRHLNQNLLENYQEVVKAMTMISNLNTCLNNSADEIRSTRDILSAADKEIYENPSRFFKQIQKQKNLNKVLELISEINDLKSMDVNELINQRYERYRKFY